MVCHGRSVSRTSLGNASGCFAPVPLSLNEFGWCLNTIGNHKPGGDMGRGKCSSPFTNRAMTGFSPNTVSRTPLLSGKASQRPS